MGGVNTEQVDYSFVLHGGNSKLWVLSIDEAGAAYHTLDPDEDFLIFYDNNTVIRSTFKRMGKKEYIVGTFALNSDEDLLTITFPNEKWDFELEFTYDKNVELTPTTQSDNQYSMLLHPLQMP